MKKLININRGLFEAQRSSDRLLQDFLTQFNMGFNPIFPTMRFITDIEFPKWINPGAWPYFSLESETDEMRILLQNN
jgi:hypothetical protein